MGTDQIFDKNEKSCILEVDLEYPQSIHDSHSNSPNGYNRKLVCTIVNKHNTLYTFIHKFKEHFKERHETS